MECEVGQALSDEEIMKLIEDNSEILNEDDLDSSKVE